MSRLAAWVRHTLFTARAISTRPQRRLRLERLESRELLSATVLVEGNGVTLTPYAGVGFQLNEVATLGGYVNGQFDTHIGDFTAQINWGDGTSTPAALAPNIGGSGYEFQVKGTHVYNQVGTYNIDVQGAGPQGAFDDEQTCRAMVSFLPSGLPATVPPAPTGPLAPSNVVTLLEGDGVTVTSFAGVGFQENMVGTVGGYLNGQVDTHISDFKAWINWGDSSQWFAADLAPNNGGSGYDFQVKGSHVYAQAGPYDVVVYATGPDGTSTSQRVDNNLVSNMPSGLPGAVPVTTAPSLPPSNVVTLAEGSGLTLLGKTGVPLQSAVVASVGGYLNGQGDPHIADFHAWINWGDSSQWTPATLVPNSGSGYDFLVQGSHTYAAPGTYPVVVYATGPDNTSTSVQTTQAQVAVYNVTVPTNLPVVASALAHSLEHYQQFITHAYLTYLGRSPAASEVAGWAGLMQNGLSDEQLEAGFIGSAEYIANHGGQGAGWVIGMYHDLLGRAPAQSEVDGWVNALNNGTTPQQVAYGFAASAERESQRVQGDYQTFLGRPASPAEVSGWVNAFAHGTSNEDVVAGFVGSPEYFLNRGQGSASVWLDAAYMDVLKRSPSQGEVNYWLGELS
jgi:hypothetical protein